MDFRSKLGWALINNIYLDTNTNYQRSKRKSREINAHNLTNDPPYAKKFISWKWNKSTKLKYQQYACRGVGCKKKVRTYCICSVVEWLCQSYFTDHVLIVHE